MLYRIFIILATIALISGCKRSSETDSTDQAFSSTNTTSTQTTTTDYHSGSVTETPTTTYAGYSIGTQEHLRSVAGDRIFFSYDQAHLDSQAQVIVQQIARWMVENPQRSLRIEGHADERGTREYNIALGERRAAAVRAFLVNSGVAGHRLSTISYGKERPATSGASPSAWAQNRRAVFVVF